jgi:hypothetical protein
MSTQRTCYTVFGYAGCGYYNRAASAASALEQELKSKVHVKSSAVSYGEWQSSLAAFKTDFKLTEGLSHRTSPIVVMSTCTDGNTNTCKENVKFIGGCDAFLAHVNKTYKS